MSEIVSDQDSTTSTTEAQILPHEPTESSENDTQRADTNDKSIAKPKRKTKTKASTDDESSPETKIEEESPITEADSEEGEK